MPVTRVVFSATAERWFLSAVADLADKNPGAAATLIERMQDLRKKLVDFPNLGERGKIPNTRRVVMAPYVLTTRHRKGILEIVAMRHARQKDAYEPKEAME